jgi:hypothetical protein
VTLNPRIETNKNVFFVCCNHNPVLSSSLTDGDESGTRKGPDCDYNKPGDESGTRKGPDCDHWYTYVLFDYWYLNQTLVLFPLWPNFQLSNLVCKQATRLYSNGEIDIMTKPLRRYFLTTFFEMNLSYISHLFKCQVHLNRFIWTFVFLLLNLYLTSNYHTITSTTALCVIWNVRYSG